MNMKYKFMSIRTHYSNLFTNAYNDFKNPQRIVLGTESKLSVVASRELPGSFLVFLSSHIANSHAPSFILLKSSLFSCPRSSTQFLSCMTGYFSFIRWWLLRLSQRGPFFVFHSMGLLIPIISSIIPICCLYRA